MATPPGYSKSKGRIIACSCHLTHAPPLVANLRSQPNLVFLFKSNNTQLSFIKEPIKSPHRERMSRCTEPVLISMATMAPSWHPHRADWLAVTSPLHQRWWWGEVHLRGLKGKPYRTALPKVLLNAHVGVSLPESQQH